MSPTSGGRLLLVEDESLLRGLVSQFLTLENFEVVAAGDGQAAVDAYLARGPFDLVLLDLNLPILPGVEACRRIKEVDAEQPFLVCSAAILDSHVAALDALGVTESLGKPYHPLELAARIRAILARREPTVSDEDQDQDQDQDGDEPQTWRSDVRQAVSPSARALSRTRAFD